MVEACLAVVLPDNRGDLTEENLCSDGKLVAKELCKGTVELLGITRICILVWGMLQARALRVAQRVISSRCMVADIMKCSPAMRLYFKVQQGGFNKVALRHRRSLQIQNRDDDI